MIKLTPPMGWNSWNTFGSEINHTLIQEIADVMVSTGLRDAGYEYVVIDDAWAEWGRGADGRLKANRNKFPEG
jgi:alpha-galactosidase